MIIPAITCLLTAAGILSAILFPDTELIERLEQEEKGCGDSNELR